MARSFVNNSVGVDLEAGRQWARMAPEIFGSPMLRAFVEVGITSGHVQVEVVSPRGGITGFQRIEFKDEYRLETMIALNAIELDDAMRYYSQFAVI